MIQALKKLKTKYLGEGINHEGQRFKASFEILSQPDIDGISFRFEARSVSGEPFHVESSLIGKNSNGKTSLWVLSSNHPGVFERPLLTDEEIPGGRNLIFGFGKKEDQKSFREEVHLVMSDNSLRYVYFWGMPGGDFAERSGCTMTATV